MLAHDRSWSAPTTVAPPPRFLQAFVGRAALRRAALQGGNHAPFSRTARRVRRTGLRLPARLLLRGRGGGPQDRGRGHLREQPPGGLAREVGRAAYRLRGPYLQRGVPPPRRPSAPRRAGQPALRRERLHAPVQDQREGG